MFKKQTCYSVWTLWVAAVPVMRDKWMASLAVHTSSIHPSGDTLFHIPLLNAVFKTGHISSKIVLTYINHYTVRWLKSSMALTNIFFAVVFDYVIHKAQNNNLSMMWMYSRGTRFMNFSHIHQPFPTRIIWQDKLHAGTKLCTKFLLTKLLTKHHFDFLQTNGYFL